MRESGGGAFVQTVLHASASREIDRIFPFGVLPACEPRQKHARQLLDALSLGRWSTFRTPRPLPHLAPLPVNTIGRVTRMDILLSIQVACHCNYSCGMQSWTVCCALTQQDGARVLDCMCPPSTARGKQLQAVAESNRV